MLAPRKKLWSTPQSAITATARLTNLTSSDKLYDIGCGNGQVILHLAKTTQCFQYVGIEIDPDRAKEAIKSIESANLDPNIKVEIRCQNALDLVELVDATVVFCYLIPRGLKLIKPVLERTVEARRRIRAKKFAKEDRDLEMKSIPAIEVETGPVLKVVTYMSKFDTETFVSKETCTVEHQSGAKWPIYLYHFN